MEEIDIAVKVDWLCEKRSEMSEEDVADSE